MRATEFLLESYINPEIDNILKAKGYTPLGKGVDQAAYIEPGSKVVLKIFGTKEGTGANGGYTPAQLTFIEFANFCKNNPDNPFLPQILGWETFEFSGDRYLQIRIERLFEFTNVEWNHELERIANNVVNGYNNMEMYIGDRLKQSGDTSVSDLEELVTTLGEDGLKLLWDTIYKLYKISINGRFKMDLHSGNFMLGSDGHIVISDPFFSGWANQ